jgi:hypothetical protein
MSVSVIESNSDFCNLPQRWSIERIEPTNSAPASLTDFGIVPIPLPLFPPSRLLPLANHLIIRQRGGESGGRYRQIKAVATQPSECIPLDTRPGAR